MLVRPMLLHLMALVSVRLFCKNLHFGQLARIFWANGLPPPLAENCPYAYKLKTSCFIMYCLFLSQRKQYTIFQNRKNIKYHALSAQPSPSVRRLVNNLRLGCPDFQN